MKRFLFLPILLLFTGCYTSNKSTKGQKDKINKIVFENFHSKDLTETSTDLEKKHESELWLMNALMSDPDTIELIIEINEDTIWRYTIDNGKILGDYERINIESGLIYWHAKIDRSIIYKQFNLFALKNDYKIQEYRDDIKMILGYECFKLRVEKIEPDISDESTGNTIYEMYVTKQIQLPVHTVINIGINIPDYFPLEIKIWEDNLKNFTEHFRIKNIL